MDKWFPIRTARLLLREFRETDESDQHLTGVWRDSYLYTRLDDAQ